MEDVIDDFGETPAQKLEEVYTTEGLRNVAMVTLAPELRGSHTAIHHLLSRGVQVCFMCYEDGSGETLFQVSMGHSEAKFDEAMSAAEAGARGLTHLWNAMRVVRWYCLNSR